MVKKNGSEAGNNITCRYHFGPVTLNNRGWVQSLQMQSSTAENVKRQCPKFDDVSVAAVTCTTFYMTQKKKQSGTPWITQGS